MKRVEPLTASQTLIEAIGAVPVPGSPPRLPRVGASIGLAFVDAALRQNHVRRVSERVELIEHGSAERTVRVDVGLRLLTDVQRQAGKEYSVLRSSSHAAAVAAQEPYVWVPVARLSRRTVSPVEVIQADGSYVPRLTQAETGRLMAAAMYRLMRSILETAPDASDPTSELYGFLHEDDEARWVVQRALMALTMERAIPIRSHDRPPTPHTVDGPGAVQRELAVSIIKANESQLGEYFRLLDVVLNDYLLVVALPANHDEHSLSYTVPLEAHDLLSSTGYVARSLWRNLTRRGSSYEVRYSVPVSSTLQAYHLLAETQSDLTISSMFLSSDAELAGSERLAQDLDHLAERVQDWKDGRSMTPGFEKILELELQTAARRLSELVRRRLWEADHVGLEMAGNTAPICRSIHAVVSNGEATLDELGQRRSSLLHHPLVSPATLRSAGSELRDQQLGWDLSAEDDPASSRAHAYWRRPSHSRTGSIDTTSVSCTIRVVDSSNVRARNVALFLVSVLGVKALVALALFGNVLFWTWGDSELSGYQADAVVAVMLLVPGYLYSRLGLPPPGSIAGILRAWTRFIAYVAIGNAALISAAVASTDESDFLAWAFWIGIAADLVSLLFLLPEFQDHPSKAAGRPGAGSPLWTRHRTHSSGRPAVVFTAVGSADGY